MCISHNLLHDQKVCNAMVKNPARKSHCVCAHNVGSREHGCRIVFAVFVGWAWPHWGVLAEGVKARCLIEVVSEASGIFPCRFPRKTILVKRPCAFQLRRLAQNTGRGGVPGHFPCAFSTAQVRTKRNISYRNLAKRELVKRSCRETSYGDLVQKFCQKDLLQRACQQSSFRDLVQDLAKRPLTEISCRDLVKRAEIFFGDLLEITSTEILPWDPLPRSSVEISCRHLVEVALHRDLAQQLLHDLLQKSFQRELAESDLLSLLFTTRVALVLLVCSHWRF